MKFFKILHNRNVIDLLSYDEKIGPAYVKFQNTNGKIVRCGVAEAQGLISDREKIYHTSALLPFPSSDMFPNVSLEEITKPEYDQIMMMNFQTPEQIRQELLMELLDRGVL